MFPYSMHKFYEAFVMRSKMCPKLVLGIKKDLAALVLQGLSYVRSTGLEPVPIAGHAPQTCAYAYSATTARSIGIIKRRRYFVKLGKEEYLQNV